MKGTELLELEYSRAMLNGIAFFVWGETMNDYKKGE